VDAIALLKKDHKEVKALFQEVEALGERANSGRQKLFRQIDLALTAHAEIEEKIFYPQFKARAEDDEETQEALEAYEEHALVKRLIAELEGMAPTDESYRAKLQVLSELVDHHVKEEEKEMFKMARDLFDTQELGELGEEMAQAKQKFLAQAKAKKPQKAA
jgi:hemerythrin superfamily protein